MYQNIIELILDHYKFKESENCPNEKYYSSDTVEQEYIKDSKKYIRDYGLRELELKSDKIYNSCSFVYKGNALNCTFSYSERLKFYKTESTDEINYFLLYAKNLNIVVFPDNSVYQEMKMKNVKRLVPLSLKATSGYLANPLFRDFILLVSSFLSRQYPIYNDVFKCWQQDGLCLVPINFNEIKDYYNLKDMFCKKYKLANELTYSWNKRSMNLSYMIIKSYNYVKPDCQNKLLQLTDFDFSDFTGYLSVKNAVIKFLSAYISKQIINSSTNTDQESVTDYVRMCLEYKEKLNLNFKSYKKVLEAHDTITEKNYMKKTPTVKIKKDSKFKELRKLLPEEFEWITTRKRLIHETAIQHHCVWSYANKINNDKCQIYSYVDKETDERYTLEFVKRGKKYVCVQISGFANKSDDGKIGDLVKILLNKKMSG